MLTQHPAQAAGTPPSGPPTTTLPLPPTTAPEQLLLTWGGDPATEVTVSWLAPGSVPQPAPTLSYSVFPITADHPGRTIQLPEPQQLDATQPYPKAASVSFADGLNTDLATPSWDLNASGNIWHESCDNSYYAVSAIENPGDGQGPPLFHLLNGDLCYANLDFFNAPSVWRDFGVNIGRSAANRPWMPALGNHECEFGIDNESGQPGTAAGGIRAQGAAGNVFNGPYGFGHYLSRFLLPDNGVINHDGNRLRGNFYAFQVGTVQFISLDADDVIYQDGASNGVPAWDTQRGTVFLVLGGGGTNGPTNKYGTDTADGLPQAKVITERNAVVGSEAAGFTKNGADSIEDAPWSAKTNAGDAYGYAIFDVDPGDGHGDTTITFQFFAIPAVSNEAGSAHDGTTTLPTTPYETLVFGRGLGASKHGKPAFATATA